MLVWYTDLSMGPHIQQLTTQLTAALVLLSNICELGFHKVPAFFLRYVAADLCFLSLLCQEFCKTDEYTGTFIGTLALPASTMVL